MEYMPKPSSEAAQGGVVGGIVGSILEGMNIKGAAVRLPLIRTIHSLRRDYYQVEAAGSHASARSWIVRRSCWRSAELLAAAI